MNYVRYKSAIAGGSLVAGESINWTILDINLDGQVYLSRPALVLIELC